MSKLNETSEPSALQTIIEYAMDNGLEDSYWELQLKLEKENPLPTKRWYPLFSQDFLKAVFGEEDGLPWFSEELGRVYFRKIPTAEFTGEEIVSWQYHAQKMVISEDPVDYVYQWIKEQQQKVFDRMADDSFREMVKEQE